MPLLSQCKYIMTTIAVDAMGGDFGLSVTVPASVAFVNRYPDARLILVGDQEQLTQALKSANAPMDKITIKGATQVVDMDESPQAALKNKKDSSMRVAINLIKEGQAEATVSAGNTGALMATARFVLKTVSGVDRPAIAKFLPNAKGGVTCALDLGANVDCTPDQLLKFGLMGSELVRSVHNKQNPTVGLLNIGSEDMKGNDVVKQTSELLKQSDLNFVGNVEGNDIYKGTVDVVVTDGFVGNVALKASEGLAKMIAGFLKEEFSRNIFTKLCAIIALPVINAFKKRADSRRYNGAIFLGLRGVVIKSHGGTDALGFGFALHEAYMEARADILTHLENGMAAHLAKKEALSQTNTDAEGTVS